MFGDERHDAVHTGSVSSVLAVASAVLDDMVVSSSGGHSHEAQEGVERHGSY
jgi:hypothetical protein